MEFIATSVPTFGPLRQLIKIKMSRRVNMEYFVQRPIQSSSKNQFCQMSIKSIQMSANSLIYFPSLVQSHVT